MSISHIVFYTIDTFNISLNGKDVFVHVTTFARVKVSKLPYICSLKRMILNYLDSFVNMYLFSFTKWRFANLVPSDIINLLFSVAHSS